MRWGVSGGGAGGGPPGCATVGEANTGGGGGGGGDSAPAPLDSKQGGSGVVILRVPTGVYSGTTSGSPTVTTSGSDKVLVFNSSGSYTT